MKAYHPEREVLALPPGHPYPSTKCRRLRTRLADRADVDIALAAPASDAALALAHDDAYVRAVAANGLDAAAQRAIGFPWSEAMVERARRSVGATVAAARAALDEGVAANLAGGTHHASAARGSGYCVFNDVAVATRLLQAEARDGRSPQGLRVAVVDLDVHQGDGTASIFAGDDSVFTLSLHGAKNFPFRKAESDLDVALPDDCGDVDYLQALDGALQVLWHEHAARPFGLAFYLAGADPHEGDRLGRLRLTAAGLAERDRRVLDGLVEHAIPVALSMAGGYGKDVEVTAELQAATIELAVDAWRRWSGRWNNAAA